MTLIQPWLAGAGFPGDEMAGLLGSLMIVGGIFGTFIATPLLDKTRNYNQAIRWSFLLSFLVMIGVVFTLQPRFPVWILCLSFFLMGMSQFPILCIVLDAAAAHTYPISEELSSAGLQFVGQYLGLPFTDLLNYLIGKSTESDAGIDYGFVAPVNVAILASFFVSAGVAMFYTGSDRRSHAGSEFGQNHTPTNDRDVRNVTPRDNEEEV
jgi:cyanate permease